MNPMIKSLLINLVYKGSNGFHFSLSRIAHQISQCTLNASVVRCNDPQESRDLHKLCILIVGCVDLLPFDTHENHTIVASFNLGLLDFRAETERKHIKNHDIDRNVSNSV
jgi:hypothetical protein